MCVSAHVAKLFDPELEVLQLFCAIGRHDQIAGEIQQHFGGVSDAVADSASYDMPGDIPPAVIADIQAIPTAFKGFASF